MCSAICSVPACAGRPSDRPGRSGRPARPRSARLPPYRPARAIDHFGQRSPGGAAGKVAGIGWRRRRRGGCCGGGGTTAAAAGAGGRCCCALSRGGRAARRRNSSTSSRCHGREQRLEVRGQGRSRDQTVESSLLTSDLAELLTSFTTSCCAVIPVPAMACRMLVSACTLRSL